MNEFYKGVILSLLTKALTGVSSVLVANGWLTENQTTQLTLGLAGLAASVLFSLWQRHSSALVKIAALQLPAGSTLEDAKRLAKTDSVAPATTPSNVAPPPVAASSGTGYTNTHSGSGSSRLPLWALIAVLPSLTLFGCGGNKSDPSLSPERKVALYGTQVSTYLKEAKTTSDNLFRDQVINKAQYEKVLLILRDANVAGDKLGAALQVYDAATSVNERSAAITQIDAALVTLNTLLPNVLAEVTNVEGRAKISRIVSEVQLIIRNITQFTAPRTGGHFLKLRPALLPVAA